MGPPGRLSFVFLIAVILIAFLCNGCADKQDDDDTDDDSDDDSDNEAPPCDEGIDCWEMDTLVESQADHVIHAKVRLDPEGVPKVLTSEVEQLLYYFPTDSGWERELVDDEYEDDGSDRYRTVVAGASDLAFGPDGTPLVCFLYMFQDPEGISYSGFAEKVGGIWKTNIFWDVAGYSCSIDALRDGTVGYISAQRFPYVAFRYQYRLDGKWHSQNYDVREMGNRGTDHRFWYNGNGEPNVIYNYHQSNPLEYQLTYAWQTADAWNSEILAQEDDWGFSGDIAADMDDSETIYILYNHCCFSCFLVYMHGTSGAWQSEILYEGDDGYMNARDIAVSPRGTPHLLYVDAWGDLVYSVKREGAWIGEILGGEYVRSFDNVSMVLDDRCLPHVSTYKRIDQTVVYAHRRGSLR